MQWQSIPAGPSEDPTMRINHETIRTAAALVVLNGLIGCGGETITVNLPVEPVYPVRGQVVLPDGKPLAEGVVRFLPVKPEARGAIGKIQADGTFELESGGLGPGAPAGAYKVVIESPATVPGPKGQKTFAVPPAYSESDNTPIEVNITTATNDLKPFNLKALPAATRANRKVSRADLRDHG